MLLKMEVLLLSRNHRLSGGLSSTFTNSVVCTTDSVWLCVYSLGVVYCVVIDIIKCDGVYRVCMYSCVYMYVKLCTYCYVWVYIEDYCVHVQCQFRNASYTKANALLYTGHTTHLFPTFALLPNYQIWYDLLLTTDLNLKNRETALLERQVSLMGRPTAASLPYVCVHEFVRVRCVCMCTCGLVACFQ